jgi:hypothetical protein
MAAFVLLEPEFLPVLTTSAVAEEGREKETPAHERNRSRSRLTCSGQLGFEAELFVTVFRTLQKVISAGSRC